MTTETILTDEQIEHGRHNTFSTNNPFCPCDSKTMRKASRWAEQAVLQSDHIRNMQGMADCMAMVRHELIEAGVVNERVPPMMVANAVLAAIQALRKDAARLDKLEADYFEPVEGGIRKHIDEAMEQQR